MKLSTAIVVSLVAHVFMIALLAFNFHFSKVEIKQTKAPRQMNATTVNAANVRKHIKSIKQKVIDKKNKEIERLRDLKRAEEKVRKTRIEEEQKIEKAKQKRKQEEKKAADVKKKRIADEKARKKKIALDKKKKAEEKKKAEAERIRKKKAAEKKKKLAEEKAAQDALEKELEQQMADEAAALNEVQQQYILTEADKYKLLIENKIHRHFIEPEQPGHCDFRIKIAPGGLIIDINVVGGDSLYCDTGRRAINKAEPLPMSTDPEVYAALKELFFRLKNKDKE